MKKSYISLMTTICFLVAFATESRAQEYAHEIGGGVGSSFYMGDANKTKLFLNSHIAAGFVYRYNVDFHWAVKTGLAVGSVSGDTNKSDNVFPNDGRYAFKRQFVDLGGQIEFSVFPYSDKYAYLGTKPYTPYLFAGSGITLASGENNFFNANIPLGIGVLLCLSIIVPVSFSSISTNSHNSAIISSSRTLIYYIQLYLYVLLIFHLTILHN